MQKIDEDREYHFFFFITSPLFCATFIFTCSSVNASSTLFTLVFIFPTIFAQRITLRNFSFVAVIKLNPSHYLVTVIYLTYSYYIYIYTYTYSSLSLVVIHLIGVVDVVTTQFIIIFFFYINICHQSQYIVQTSSPCGFPYGIGPPHSSVGLSSIFSYLTNRFFKEFFCRMM